MDELNNNGLKKKHVGKKVIIIISIVAILFISNLGFFYLGNRFAFSGISLNSINKEVASEIKDTKKYDLLFEVRNTLLSKYDGEIDDEQLLQAAIKGMTLSLQDPYTVFMNAGEYKSFVEQSEGHFVGIGAQLGIKDDKVTIVAPIEGSPADKAGVKAGDVVLKVDDISITGVSVEKTISLIKGEDGKEVKLTLERNGEAPIDIKIIRGVVNMVAVKGEMIDETVGYIQMSSFDENVAKDFENKIVELKAVGMKGLIVDLRGNPGGFLGESVKVASQFIPKGKVVTYTIDKYDKKIESKSVGGTAEGMPLVVLIDGGSASASEVVTGALRDYGVATTIGVNSFGKGVVQQLIEFKDGLGGLKVTTSKYYTPNGENIHKIGIKPDIEVKIPEEFLKAEYNRTKDPQFTKGLEVIREKLK
ncbi:S41 family peptidase [Clostridium gasigenes]|uniref:S41 family peptidase n=1 Tax=Clostridium gasigenes TaxID=94869 RepID=UPI001C0C22A0|nr:S41 family peptidase [Clostridium gasigenes]MBU3108103.1 S41 family peptidase [Clostridium gasigenes]